MSIYHNGHKIKAIYRGSAPVARAIHNGQNIWQKEVATPIDPSTISLQIINGWYIRVDGAEELISQGYKLYIFRYGRFRNRLYTNGELDYATFFGWRATGGHSYDLGQDNYIMWIEKSKKVKADFSKLITWKVEEVEREDGSYATRSTVGWGISRIRASDDRGYGYRDGAFKAAIAFGPQIANRYITAITPEMMVTPLYQFEITTHQEPDSVEINDLHLI